jgi:hypothetical protein
MGIFVTMEPGGELSSILMMIAFPRRVSIRSPNRIYNLVVIVAGACGVVSAAGAAGLDPEWPSSRRISWAAIA